MYKEVKSTEWFASWFNSPYYHLLYDKRSDEEASGFISNLIQFLNPTANSTVLDLACGAGRHARELAKHALLVSGCDLSVNSIEEAKLKSPKGIRFFVHDMRNHLPEKYHYIFNLFTSFGYFEDVSENAIVLKNIHEALHPNGIFVLDFMNTDYVIENLVPHETILKNNISFDITRKVNNGFIEKSISFTENNQKFHFTERVQVFSENDFEKLLSNANFTILKKAGDYNLNNFDNRNSKRLILICSKV